MEQKGKMKILHEGTDWSKTGFCSLLQKLKVPPATLGYHWFANTNLPNRVLNAARSFFAQGLGFLYKGNHVICVLVSWA
jgi:hypothetical protein